MSVWGAFGLFMGGGVLIVVGVVFFRELWQQVQYHATIIRVARDEQAAIGHWLDDLEDRIAALERRQEEREGEL